MDAYRDAKSSTRRSRSPAKPSQANPKNRELKLMLAGELVDQGKADEGCHGQRPAQQHRRTIAAVWLALGQIDIRLRRWKDAEDALSKADAADHQEGRPHLPALPEGRAGGAAEALSSRPSSTSARRWSWTPTNAMTLNYLGYMLADKGSGLPEALKMIRKAVELEPMNGAYLDSLGWAYFKLGEYELAEENLRQAVERDQTDPTVHDHLGDLYEKTGRIRLAAAQWELSLAEYREVRRCRRGTGRSGQGAAQAGKRPREAGQAGNTAGQPKPE